MNEIITTTIADAATSRTLPVPAAPISVRLATVDDLAFIDALQKQHGKQLGFFPRAQMQGYVENGWMLIAEDAGTGERVGYCASRDRYLKRDELGVIFQLCVVPGGRRRLIGATLLKAVFERSAYGTRLYCCWCAQDLKANYFWESMGFVPLAARAGSGKRSRVHIFWQARIRQGDEQTPWWYPCGTDGGAMRAGRVVVPIPPGVSWREATVPTVAVGQDEQPASRRQRRAKTAARAQVAEATPSAQRPLTRGLRFVTTATAEPVSVASTAPVAVERPKRAAVKVDPALIARARELRDRWLEHVNTTPLVGQGKYDVTRGIMGDEEISGGRAFVSSTPQRTMLPAA
jgi:N-acetylglutamate synthase-like GNAT family acetyltransferase